MNILITGASRGIGYETALLFAANPDHQVYALSRNVERLEELTTTAQQRHGHGNLHIIPFDITSLEIAEFTRQIEPIGQVDILINNAGQLIAKPFAETTMQEWEHLFMVNVFGVVRLVRVLLPYLEKSKRAHIVNIGSMGGFQGSSKFPGLAAYSSSKAALANMSECMAEEFKDKNIACNCLALGAVQTEMLEQAFPGIEAPMTSMEMAEYLAYFAEHGHRFMNGKVIPVSISTP